MPYLNTQMFLSMPNHMNNINIFSLQNHKCQTQPHTNWSQVQCNRKRKWT